MSIRTGFFRVMFLVVCASFLIGVPWTIQAAEATCDCFCTSSTGAVDQKTKMTAALCLSTCQKKGEQIAAFACTANQYPSRTLNCFTEAQCTEHRGTWDDGFQPPECSNGFHYCYPDSSTAVKAKLQVSIGGLTSPEDLGEYVAAVYKWMLGSATLIAIVFIMIGGLQWSIAAVSAEQIGKAKKRIVNSVAGLVLLLSTYLILQTVNPNLLKLKVPDFPLLKTVSLVDEASCDVLLTEGYTIDDGGKAHECGTVGTVEKDANGAAVADGTVCNFSKCALPNEEICVPGEKPECMKCQEITASNSVVMASQSVCSAFNSLPDYETKKEKKDFVFTTSSGEARPYSLNIVKQYQQCFFTRDPDAGGQLIGRAACALVQIDCNNITSCGNYDSVQVLTGTGHTGLDNLNIGANSGLTGAPSEVIMSELGELTLGSFCQNTQLSDMCGYNRGTSPKACYIDSTSFSDFTLFQTLFPTNISDIAAYVSGISYDCQDSSFWPSWLSF